MATVSRVTIFTLYLQHKSLRQLTDFGVQNFDVDRRFRLFVTANHIACTAEHWFFQSVIWFG
jgi:hypothetical protein